MRTSPILIYWIPVVRGKYTHKRHTSISQAKELVWSPAEYCRRSNINTQCVESAFAYFVQSIIKVLNLILNSSFVLGGPSCRTSHEIQCRMVWLNSLPCDTGTHLYNVDGSCIHYRGLE
jgi:hypothetical protein